MLHNLLWFGTLLDRATMEATIGPQWYSQLVAPCTVYRMYTVHQPIVPIQVGKCIIPSIILTKYMYIQNPYTNLRALTHLNTEGNVIECPASLRPMNTARGWLSWNGRALFISTTHPIDCILSKFLPHKLFIFGLTSINTIMLHAYRQADYKIKYKIMPSFGIMCPANHGVVSHRC